MFSCLAAPQQSYNVAIGLFTLYSSYQRIGLINFHCLGMHVAALVIDILMLSLFADSWSRGRPLASLTLSVLLINLCIKSLGVLAMIVVHAELGQSTYSVGGVGTMGAPMPREPAAPLPVAHPLQLPFAQPAAPAGMYQQQGGGGAFGGIAASASCPSARPAEHVALLSGSAEHRGGGGSSSRGHSRGSSIHSTPTHAAQAAAAAATLPPSAALAKEQPYAGSYQAV